MQIDEKKVRMEIYEDTLLEMEKIISDCFNPQVMITPDMKLAEIFRQALYETRINLSKLNNIVVINR